MTVLELELSKEQKKVLILQDRARMMVKTRNFFFDRSILEVDCPALTSMASIDPHIDLIPACYFEKYERYLYSSPEYGMKRLLAMGIGDIFQLSHVFRDGEQGQLHNPEFMMAEWYRCDTSFKEMIRETQEFISLFLENDPLHVLTYRDAFKQYLDIDYVTVPTERLRNCLTEHAIDLHSDQGDMDRDELLNLLLGHVVEPFLGKNDVCVLIHYPATQAALARTTIVDGIEVAERFEIYRSGIELANGYHELKDAAEQSRRFEEYNIKREKMGKRVLPIDKRFLKSLEGNFPDCCGVAVGFDRLMMMRHEVPEISEVLPFPWDEA